jgi:hypothetical protein
MTRLYVFAAVGIACFFAGGTAAWNVQGWRLGEQISDLRAAYTESARVAEASAREKEHAAATTLATIEQKASDEKKRLAADLAAAHRELRNRPKRPSGRDVPKSPADSVGCTGAQLFAEDAGAALREAARADAVRLQLEACKAAYDEAVKLTN